jgi:hypothetical protein
MDYLLAGISLFTGFVIALLVPVVGLAKGPRRLSFDAVHTLFSGRFWLLAIGIFNGLVLITHNYS